MSRLLRQLTNSFAGLTGLLLVCISSQTWACPQDTPKEDGPHVKIQSDQERLSEQYRLLEEKLFSLHEYEKGQNPSRSKLLKQAFLQSQEKMTAVQLRRVVKLLKGTQLKDAEKEQAVVLAQLGELLELLQSEDRGKRVRDDIKRNQAYLKEVERILRIQKGVRGQAEGGSDTQRLARDQASTAKRTKSLADQIKSESPKQPPASDSKPSENKPGEGKPSNSKQPGSPSKGQPSPPSSDQPSSSPPASQAPTEDQVRQRIQAAQQQMEQAKQKLEQAKRGNAIEAMHQAEREMAKAKKALEAILRQLREEEVERSLAMLESRFRIMLERETRICEATKKLRKTPPEQRKTDFEIRAGKLSADQGAIAQEASRTLLLLKEDGSSIAFPVTVEEMHEDMLQVTQRLAAAKVGEMTVAIEEDIIETLNFLIEALVRSQQDAAKKKKNGKQGKSRPGKSALVDQLAEIKMLKALQQRIHQRHRRYSRFLDNPQDQIGEANDPEVRAALGRLAAKQAKLTTIARDIVNEKNN